MQGKGERVFTEEGLAELSIREVYEGIQKGEISLYDFEWYVELKENVPDEYAQFQYEDDYE